MDVAALKATRRELPEPIKLPEGEIRVSYAPRKNTLGLVTALNQAADADLGTLSRFLLAVEMDWDLTNNGEPYPVTAETLLEMDFTVLVAISQAISGDLRPNLPGGSKTANG